MKAILRIVFFAGVLWTGIADGTTIVWTNTAGGNWNNAANWAPNQVPSTTNDFAIITNAGTYSVSLDISPNLGGFTLGSGSLVSTQSLSINGLTFTVTNGLVKPGGVINLNSGILTGTCTVAGTLNWTVGYMDGPGIISIATNGLFLMNCSSFDEVRNDNIIVNAGTVIWTNGDFYLEFGSVFTNLAGALFETRFDGNLIPYGSATAFYNSGTFRKSAGRAARRSGLFLTTTGR